jgi:hypothetical protein
MTRRPPSILSAVPTSDGNINVTWQVDTFFPDSAPPEKVIIDLNGILFRELDGDEDSIDIPQATIAGLGTSVVAISVSFWWSGSPAEEQQSTVTLPVQTGGAGPATSGVFPAAIPVVSVVDVLPHTLHSPNRITIAWRSNNYNDGNIVWGQTNAPEAFKRSIKPRGEIYHGTFTTDQPLIPASNYVFKVEVRNTLHSTRWISTTVVVRSAPGFNSLRQFLQASGVPIPCRLRTIMQSGGRLRHLLQR